MLFLFYFTTSLCDLVRGSYQFQISCLWESKQKFLIMKNLVSYSSSEEEEEPKPKKVKLPLTLKIEEGPEEDDPSEHGGRQRAIKHERGIWATYIYIPFSEENQEVLQKIQRKFKSLFSNKELREILEPHISLTKLLILRHHWIQQFTEEIRGKISEVKKFKVTLEKVEFYCNEEKTRTFIGLKTENNRLEDCVTRIDETLEEFKLPKFYENPSFHASILWCLGDQVESLKKLKPVLQNCLEEIFEEEESFLELFADEMNCKCGNRIYKFKLK